MVEYLIQVSDALRMISWVVMSVSMLIFVLLLIISIEDVDGNDFSKWLRGLVIAIIVSMSCIVFIPSGEVIYLSLN